MTGDEEGDALRPDVLVRQPLAGLVHPGQHPSQQVRGVGVLALRAPLGDRSVHQRVHEGVVLLPLALRPDPQSGLDRQLPHARSATPRVRTMASTNGCGVSR